MKLGGIVDNQAIVAVLDDTQLQLVRPIQPAPGPEPTPFDLLAMARPPLDISHPIAAAAQFRVWATQFHVGSEAFGSELITGLWSEHARVFRFDTRRWSRSKNAVRLLRVDRQEDRGHYRVELAIPELGRAGTGSSSPTGTAPATPACSRRSLAVRRARSTSWWGTSASRVPTRSTA